MREVIRKAYAKINLGLDVLGRRADGYHLVRMIMQTIDVYDELRMRVIPEGEVILHCDQKDLPCDENNLCVKAAQCMRERFAIEQGLEIELTKRIPVAAGLAGGSTDAAAVMLGICQLFSLQPSLTELMQIALSLGADVPYCLRGGSALAEGIGEILSPLRPELAPLCCLLVKPKVGVSTKEVYQALDARELLSHPDIDSQREAIERGEMELLCRNLGNVLESVTIPLHPEIAQIKSFLLEKGARAALMSGSGPSVFAIFLEEEDMLACKKKLEESRLSEQIEAIFATHTIGSHEEVL